MFDIGWTEMMVVAVVAILFVGPKELPGMLRTFGRSIKKLRSMAGDFQKQFDDALKDAELDGVKDTLDEVRNLNPAKKIKDHLNPIKQELDGAKKLVEDAGDFDPDKDFDESKLPNPPKPVEVDVEAALKRQREADAIEKAELAAEAKKATAKKSTSKKSSAKNSSNRKSTATKPRSNKAKKAAPKSTGSVTKQRGRIAKSASKTTAKPSSVRKTTRKTTTKNAEKAKPAKKANA